MYKNSGVAIDDGWANTLTSNCSETVREFLATEFNEEIASGTQENEGLNYDSDHFSEIDETENIVSYSDTLLDSADLSNDNV
ncbi:hypothetical protein DPMN_110619 [Dreissena polymorpha]|uniref:Uncharacterized protein n=1 Tax=Dreissena polymorpha TaxID=45954 RepID=A0A9D4QN77_DREPO|nr:hypothetical protein DPMN_110619 [Dreissena polymorpha]